jgi:hypothetical protein
MRSAGSRGETHGLIGGHWTSAGPCCCFPGTRPSGVAVGDDAAAGLDNTAILERAVRQRDGVHLAVAQKIADAARIDVAPFGFLFG